MEVGTPDCTTPRVPSPVRERLLGTTLRGECVVGGWGNRTHRPSGCKQDTRPGGVATILNVASPKLGQGEVFLRGGPILLQEWPKGDSQREERVSRVYHRILKLE